MPYVPKPTRDRLSEPVASTAFHVDNAGQLNYAITKICLEYLGRRGELHYDDYNEVIGVLESAKLEFYRRAVSPYEDEAIERNGDVY